MDSVSEDLVRENLPPVRFFLSTGSTILDLAISGRYPGGVGSGRVTQIIGNNSTAKSVISKEIMGSAQRAGGTAIEEDAEFTPDFDRAELFGLDVGDWVKEDVQLDGPDKTMKDAQRYAEGYLYRNPASIEEVFDDEISGAVDLIDGVWGKKKGLPRMPQPVVMSVDTFTALPSCDETDEALEGASYNTVRAKRMSAGFRKWLKPIATHDLTVVAVDHIRDNVGVIFGPKWTTSGGKAMQQYASTRIFLARDKTGDIKNKHEKLIGIKVKFSVVKNKIAPPHREGFFFVVFDYGVDDVRSNLEWLKENDDAVDDSKFVKAGSWFSWGDLALGQGMGAAIAGIEKNSLEEEVRQEVVRIWNVVHEPPERKPRQR